MKKLITFLLILVILFYIMKFKTNNTNYVNVNENLNSNNNYKYYNENIIDINNVISNNLKNNSTLEQDIVNNMKLNYNRHFIKNSSTFQPLLSNNKGSPIF